MNPRLGLVTGPRGVGKTRLCEILAGRSEAFAGVVCPGLFDGDGRKIGFDARCLRSGEMWPLGRSEQVLDGPRVGRFATSQAGFDRAVRCLQDALEDRSGVCIIDEIGPLELEDGGGFAPILPLLGIAGDLLIVAREELVDPVRRLAPTHPAMVFRVTTANDGSLAEEIVSFFGV